MANLTRDEEMKVLLYKGPATAYVEDVVAVTRKEGYRLIDSRHVKQSFISKMKTIEAATGVKMMIVEGKDVNLFTPKPKEAKMLSKTSEQRAIESNEAVAKAIQMIAENNSNGGSDKALIEAQAKSVEAEKETEALRKELADLKKKK